jgi:hypothetical protein
MTVEDAVCQFRHRQKIKGTDAHVTVIRFWRWLILSDWNRGIRFVERDPTRRDFGFGIK